MWRVLIKYWAGIASEEQREVKEMQESKYRPVENSISWQTIAFSQIIAWRMFPMYQIQEKCKETS